MDPATLGDAGQRFTINQYDASPDGRYVAYQTAADGESIGSLRIVELATGRTLETIDQSDAVIASPSAADLKPILYLAKDAPYVRAHEVGVSRFVRVPLDGRTSATVPLPFARNVQDIATDPQLPGVLFTLQSWTRAPRLYSFDPAAGTVKDLAIGGAIRLLDQPAPAMARGDMLETGGAWNQNCKGVNEAGSRGNRAFGVRFHRT